MNKEPAILTNMIFWQSPVWVAAAHSILPGHGKNNPPAPSALRQAWKLFANRRHYEVIHTMGVRESTLYGLLCLIANTPSKQIMTEVFLDEPSPANPAWHLKNRLQIKIAQRAIGLLTNSQAEIPALAERLHLPTNRFRFVPLNSNIDPAPAPLPGEGFILAAGRSQRDYATLLRAAPGIDAPITIIGGTEDLPRTALPPNVTMLRDVENETYLDLLRRCTICVLPLHETIRPAGQLVMLEAMSQGKPVVATRNIGTVNYITDRQNGLLTAPGDHLALQWAIQSLLNDPVQRARIAAEALATIKSRHTHDQHARNRLQAIHELLLAPRPEKNAGIPRK